MERRGDKKELEVLQKKLEDNNLKVEDLFCAICTELIEKPQVKLPCSHKLCEDCFEKILSDSNLNCPFCRSRLSSWTREVRGGKRKLNYEKLPNKILAKISKNSRQRLSQLIAPSVQHQFYEEGELRSEYEELLEEANKLAQKKQSEEKIEKLLAQYEELSKAHMASCQNSSDDYRFACKLQRKEYRYYKVDRRSDRNENRYQLRKRKVRDA